jgi:DNA-binding HxlR family transcriptional regulator
MSRHPIVDLLDLLGRRWALRVLWELRDGPLPYRRLRERCDEVSTSVLAQRLRELVEAGVVDQHDDGYALSRAGRDIAEHLLAMNDVAKRLAQPPKGAARA